VPPKSTKLAIGGAALARLGEKALSDALSAYASAGGQWLDISPAYGGWAQVSAIGAAVRREAPNLRPLIKLGYFADGKSYRDPVRVRAQCARLVQAFGVAPVAVMLHEADWKIWWQEVEHPAGLLGPNDTITSDVPAMLEGLGREYGCKTGLSGNNADALATALSACPEAQIVLMAKQTDLLWSSGDTLATRLVAEGRTVLLAAPFHQGWLLRLRDIHWIRPVLKHSAHLLGDILASAHVTVEEAAIPFLRSLHPGAAVMVGATQLSEVRLACEAIDRPMPQPLFDRIVANRCSAAAMPGRPLMRTSEDLLAVRW
jgi:aryl-alcohol dehydrogenase-like predicted oxidoreductase